MNLQRLKLGLQSRIEHQGRLFFFIILTALFFTIFFFRLPRLQEMQLKELQATAELAGSEASHYFAFLLFLSKILID